MRHNYAAVVRMQQLDQMLREGAIYPVVDFAIAITAALISSFLILLGRW